MRTRKTRTQDLPLRIDWLPEHELSGRLGLTLAPGKKQLKGLSGVHDRNEVEDLAALKAAGVTTVVSLLTDREYAELRIAGQPERIKAFAVHRRLPIQDRGVPGESLKEWDRFITEIVWRLKLGERVVAHCMGGLGRAGMVAACVLVRLGYYSRTAMRTVRTARPGAIETRLQEDLIAGYELHCVDCPMPRLSFRDMEVAIDKINSRSQGA